VRELLGAGHTVLGLARSDASANALRQQQGIEVHRGELSKPETLAAGARTCDGVIHTAYIHDFSQIAANAQADRGAIEAIGAALEGSNRPFLITSGTAGLAPGRPGSEDDPGDVNNPTAFRIQSELMTVARASRGVRASVIRLPPSVHGPGDHGFVPRLIAIAREKGVSAYVGDGQNRWPAVHRLDAAILYRLALEKGAAGSRFHVVGDPGVPTKDIATVIGKHLGLPVVSKSAAEINDHFGWLGHFFALDVPASSEKTQQQLGWKPRQPGLIEDLDEGHYFAG
jgi:nucleoside-diphosphate-sugar epimerase